MARKQVRSALIRLVTVIAVSAAVVAVSTGPAGAQGENANATGAIINGGRIAPADCPPGGGAGPVDPGANALIDVGVVEAECTSTSARASAANATLLGGALQLGVIQSQCTTGPAGTASSSVLVLNGAGVLPGGVITQPTTVTLPGLITLTLNEVIETPTTRTVNALHVTGLGLDVIVAQSQCSKAPPYPLAAGNDTNQVVQEVTPSADSRSDGAPAWLVVTAALALLAVVNVVFVGSVRRRRATIRT